MTDQDTGQVVMAALQGHTTAGGGSWVDVKVNPSGALSADVTGTVATTQSTSPWVVSGTVNSSILNPSTTVINFPATQAVSGTVNASVLNPSSYITNFPATQTVSATNLDIRDLTSASDSVTAVISGSVNTSILNASTYVTNASIPVTGTFYQSTQPVSIASTIATSAVNLDIRDLTSVSDSVTAVISGLVNTSSYITNASIPITAGTLNTSILNPSTWFYPATQPVSLAATVNTSILNPSTFFYPATQPVSVAATLNTSILGGTTNVTQLGTWNIGTLTTATTVSSLTGGGTLVDAAVNLNPHNIGARAAQANPTAVSASGDLVNLMADDVGRLVMVKNHVRDLVTQNRLVLASSTETSILAAGGSGVFQDLTAITVANTSTSTPVNVDIRDATTGTVRLTLTCPGSATTGIIFDSPFIQTTANNPWTIQCSAAVSSIITMVQAVKNV
jgi:hypothetical protein